MSGNTESFVLDLSVYNNIKIKADSVIKLPIKFAPQFVGVHEINIEITSDAAPNYQQTKSQFTITGYSRAIDTTKMKVGLIGETQLVACNTYSLIPFVINEGNTQLSLNKFEYKTNDSSNVKWIDSLENDTPFAPGDTLKYKLSITPTANNNAGVIDFDATANTNIHKSYSYNYTNQVNNLELVHINDFKFVPGDSLNLNFSGKFPNITDLPVDLELIIGLEDINFCLVSKNVELIIEKK